MFLFYAFQNFRFRGINAVRQNDGTVAVGFDFSAPGIFYGNSPMSARTPLYSNARSASSVVQSIL
ncbi:MAG: hypothetical protein ACLRSW_09220 [Christensenellaceae bacterium]